MRLLRKLIPPAFAFTAACASSHAATIGQLPIYPRGEYGRIGCFAGASLNRMSGETTVEPSAALSTGPWLVLDSVSEFEWRSAHPEHTAPIETRILQQATLLAQRETLVWVGGFWRRSDGDTIVFREASTFPSVTWRLAQASFGLVGTGEVVSDLRSRLPDGSDLPSTRTWAVAAARVPCERIPQRPPNWPR